MRAWMLRDKDDGKVLCGESCKAKYVYFTRRVAKAQCTIMNKFYWNTGKDKYEVVEYELVEVGVVQ